MKKHTIKGKRGRRRKFFTTIAVALGLVVFLAAAIIYAFPGFTYQCTIQTLRWWGGLSLHRVQVDNHRWVYLEGGEGEPILFIHGFGADKERWGTLLSDFSGSYRVIAPDLPGFGENTKIPSATYDIPTQVNRLDRFAEAIGLRRFHLIGISMGGYIAAYYAGEFPEKVKSLALMDAAGVESPIPSDLRIAIEETGRIPLLYRTPEELETLMGYLFYRPPWIPQPYKVFFAQRGALEYPFRRKILKDMVETGMNLLDNRLQKIEAPSLIIWGAQDRVFHVSSVKKFQAGLRGVQTALVEECGHVPHIEKPRETERIYRTFLAGIQRSR